MEYRVCTKCGSELSATTEFFYRAKTGGNGLQAECKQCNKERQRRWLEAHPDYHRDWKRRNSEKSRKWCRRWRENNPEKMREACRRWERAHPEERKAINRNREARILGNGGTHTAEDIHAQHERQLGRCFYCETALDKYHVDHVMPLALGGSNGPENLVIACPTCNIRKKDKHPMEWCGMLL